MFAAYMDMLWVYVEDLPIHFFTYAASEGCFGIAKNLGEEDAYYVLLPDTCFYEFLSETGTVSGFIRFEMLRLAANMRF